MRLFLAIDFPPKIKRQFHDELKELIQDYRQFSWVPEENYHITLHFLGEVEDVEQIKRDIEEIVFDIPAFMLYGLSADLFIRTSVLLYIDFVREKLLEKLVGKIKNRYAVDLNQPFVPHLTVARYKIPSKQQYLLLRKRLQKMSINTEHEVKKITLFESVLGGKRIAYRKIVDFNLLHK